ncbi:septum formation family protein [Nocardioides sp. AE5]|uniref:septum formation family protein n=1 Tax=Nocardioides sp. AE5 TaxID=2962573 RepID=UPI002881FFB9|nr:septum formation family protein [Nocardioides sp. AE5]MDT0203280.1 septum formation family protein [Nocardioides sp. AE5]
MSRVHTTRARLGAGLGALVLALGVLGACSGDEEPTAAPSESASPTPAVAPAGPEVGECHDLAYADALSPTDTAEPVDCAGAHTSQTYAVGELDTVVDGHLVAVDSAHVREQVAAACPARLAKFVGGSEEALRLSMIRPIWFSPTLEQSDAGHNWYRCDAVVLAGPEKFLPLTADLKGVLGTSEGRERFALCSTGKPGTDDFSRVVCSAKHSWRAISTTTIKAGADGAWPGEKAARAAGESACKAEAQDRAEDKLKFTWSYEWPSQEQWAAGTRHGTCWIPAS